MGIRLIIEGNTAYEIDEDCLAARQEIWDSDSEEKPRENQEERRRAKNYIKPLPYFSDCPDRGFMIKFKKELRVEEEFQLTEK